MPTNIAHCHQVILICEVSDDHAAIYGLKSKPTTVADQTKACRQDGEIYAERLSLVKVMSFSLQFCGIGPCRDLMIVAGLRLLLINVTDIFLDGHAKVPRR